MQIRANMVALVVVALGVGVGCDGRVMAAGHLTTLGLSLGMLWATLNLNRAR